MFMKNLYRTNVCLCIIYILKLNMCNEMFCLVVNQEIFYFFDFKNAKGIFVLS